MARKRAELPLRVDRRPVAPGDLGGLRVQGRPVAGADDGRWWTGSPTTVVAGASVARAGDRFESPAGTLAVHARALDADAGERRLEVRCEGPQGEPVEGALARCRFADDEPREREVRGGRAVFAALPTKKVALEVLHPHLIQPGPMRLRCRKGRTLAVVRLERHHVGHLCDGRRIRLASDGEDEAHWQVLAPPWEALAPPAPPPPPSLDHHQPRYVFDAFDACVRAAGPRPLLVGPLLSQAQLPRWCSRYVERRVSLLQQRQDLRSPDLHPRTQAWQEALANVVQTTIGRYSAPEASHGFLVTPPPATHGPPGRLAWPRVSPVAHSWGRPPHVVGWYLTDALLPDDTDEVDPEAVLAHVVEEAHRMTPAALLVLALSEGPDVTACLAPFLAIRRRLSKGARRRLVLRCPLSVLTTPPRAARAIADGLPKRTGLWLDVQLCAGDSGPAPATDWVMQQQVVRTLLDPLLATRRVLALTLRRPGPLLRPPAEVAMHGALAAAKKQRAIDMLPRGISQPAPPRWRP